MKYSIKEIIKCPECNSVLVDIIDVMGDVNGYCLKCGHGWAIWWEDMPRTMETHA